MNEERQDKDRRIYEIIFSFSGDSCDQLVGSPCVLLNHPRSFITIYQLCSAHAKCGLEVSHNCKSFVVNIYMVVSDTWNMIDGLPLL